MGFFFVTNLSETFTVEQNYRHMKIEKNLYDAERFEISQNYQTEPKAGIGSKARIRLENREMETTSESRPRGLGIQDPTAQVLDLKVYLAQMSSQVLL